MSGVAGSDITGDMSLTLAKLRRENALSDVVHDPEEDAPPRGGHPEAVRPLDFRQTTQQLAPPPRAGFWRRLLNRPRPI